MTPPRHLAIYRAFQLPLIAISIARWINQDFFRILDSFLTAGGSIKLPFRFLLICPSTTSSVNAFLLDTSIGQDLLGFYLSVNRDFPLIFLNLSLDRLVFSPPKTLSLTPNLIPMCSSSFFELFSSLGKFLFSHLHVFHVLKPRFWGFSKLMSFCWNFGMGFCLNEFKISYIASHKHYNSIIMHLDMCKLIMCW